MAGPMAAHGQPRVGGVCSDFRKGPSYKSKLHKYQLEQSLRKL